MLALYRVFCKKNPQCGFFLQINPRTQKSTDQPSKCQSNRNITLGRIYVYLTVYNFNIFSILGRFGANFLMKKIVELVV